MSKTATEDLLSILHNAIAEDLLRRIEAGEASAADLSVAVKFLKDNGIDCESGKSPLLQSLAHSIQLPFDDDDMVVQ